MKFLYSGFFLLCFLIGSQPCFGQQKKIDSLWTVWHDSSQADTNRLKAINTIIWNVYLFTHPDTAYHLAEQQYKMAKEIDNKEHMAMALNKQGIAAGIMGNYDLALTRIVHAYNIYKTLNYRVTMARIQSNIALLYSKIDKNLEAIENYGECIKIQEELKDSLGMSNSLLNLGQIYDKQGHHDQALSYYTRSLDLVKKLNAKQNISQALISIGSIYLDLEEYLTAKDHFMQSLIICEEINDDIAISNALIGLGQIEQKLGNHSLAMEYFYMALEITKELGDKEAISSSLLGLATSHALQGNHREAIELGSDAIKIAADIPSQTRAAAKILYESYKTIGKNLKALEMHELYIQMHDSIVNEETKEASIRQQYKFTYEKKAAADSLHHVAAINEQDIKIAFQNKLGFALVIFLLSILVFSFLLFKRFQITRDQKQIIEAASTRTKDSIMYAKRIQRSILTSDTYIKSCLDDYYILYKPKDIVSGDFYWLYKQENGSVLIAMADCTGHGVPGAFMSMIGAALLNEIIIEKGVTKVNEVLELIRTHIISAFEQKGSKHHIQDGMDITFIDYNAAKRTLSFSGAGQRFYILRDGEFIEIKGNSCPVGYYFGREKPFDLKEITLMPKDQLYLFSDGIVDQFGGEDRKKFGFNRLQEAISEGASLSMDEQKKILEDALLSWQGHYEQIDDISVMGIKVS